MEYKHKIDRNTLILHDVLEAMTIYNYENEIKVKLNKFILYLEEFLFFNDSNNDIVNEELIHIVTYDE